MNKVIYQLVGFICLALGFVGIVLPIMPTTPFLILAAFCFKHGSEKYYQWILNNPIFGKPVRDWDENKVIAPKNKLISCALIFFCIGHSVFFRPIGFFLKLILTLIGFAISFFILSCKSHKDNQEMVAIISSHDPN